MRPNGVTSALGVRNEELGYAFFQKAFVSIRALSSNANQNSSLFTLHYLLFHEKIS